MESQLFAEEIVKNYHVTVVHVSMEWKLKILRKWKKFLTNKKKMKLLLKIYRSLSIKTLERKSTWFWFIEGQHWKNLACCFTTTITSFRNCNNRKLLAIPVLKNFINFIIWLNILADISSRVVSAPNNKIRIFK